MIFTASNDRYIERSTLDALYRSRIAGESITGEIEILGIFFSVVRGAAGGWFHRSQTG